MSDQKFLNLDEKYKPKTIKDIVGQPHIQKQLKTIVETGNLQHMLFYGPPGVGKTSSAIALAHDLFKDKWKYGIFIYNASDDRSINFIRGEIKNIIMTAPMDTAYRIIFLDEADELTVAAQAALREIMQKHTDTTKFILSCNYPDNIIEPIKDRCTILHFKPISQDAIVDRLKAICASERINYDEGALEAIAEAASGSLRKAIKFVDSSRDRNNHIAKDQFETDLALSERVIDLLLESILASDMSRCSVQLRTLYQNNNKFRDIFIQLIKAIDNNPSINEAVKQDMIDQTGQYEWRISQGANEQLQIRCYLNSLIGVVDRHKHSDG